MTPRQITSRHTTSRRVCVSGSGGVCAQPLPAGQLSSRRFYKKKWDGEIKKKTKMKNENKNKRRKGVSI